MRSPKEIQHPFLSKAGVIIVLKKYVRRYHINNSFKHNDKQPEKQILDGKRVQHWMERSNLESSNSTLEAPIKFTNLRLHKLSMTSNDSRSTRNPDMFKKKKFINKWKKKNIIVSANKLSAPLTCHVRSFRGTEYVFLTYIAIKILQKGQQKPVV